MKRRTVPLGDFPTILAALTLGAIGGGVAKASDLLAPADAAVAPLALPVPDGPPDDPDACLPDAMLRDAGGLRTLVETRPEELGPLSIGAPGAGLLFNPMPMSAGPYWQVRDPRESYATAETIDFVVRAVEAVEARFPGSPRVVVGDLSRADGGRLNRHRSHQVGRDADIGFYYSRGEVQAFAVPRRRELDLPRTWTLVRALVTETDIDRIFLDRSIQRVLYDYALGEGESRAWLDDIFGHTGEKGIIQHERRHKDHLHARFYNRRAQEWGRVAYPLLVEAELVPGPTATHVVRRGETIGGLARRYGVSVVAIRSANGLKSSQLRAGHRYIIPLRRVPPESEPIAVPPRRLPPPAAAADYAAPAAGGGAPVADAR